MAKQLRYMPEKKQLPDMKSAQMKQDAMLMQGVSSRLQIKERLRKEATKPVEVQSKSKRLQKPVSNPDFITPGAGYGRMSKGQMREMKREDFSKQAEQMFGNIGQSASYDDDFDFL